MPFRIRVSALTALLSALLISVVASADPPPLASSLTGDAKAAYEGGRLLYNDKDYAGAATKYRAAYTISRDPRLLWNIATCKKELRHYAEAAALVERFIADAKPLVAPEFLLQAQTTLDALRDFYSPVAVTVQPPGARLSIDSVDVGLAPFVAPVRVDLGTHVVRAEREGFITYEAPVQVAGHNALALTITLVPRANEAQLAVAASDAADVVTVDDAVVGSGHWQGPVAAGSHHLKVSAPGKKTYSLDVEVTAGEKRSIDVTLEKEHGRAIWPWIVGGAGVVVAGGIVTAFLLASPGGATTSAPPSGAGASTIKLSSLGRAR